MEELLVKKTYILDNTSFKCWMIKIGYFFWIKAPDIAVFLCYKNPKQAARSNVPSEARKHEAN